LFGARFVRADVPNARYLKSALIESSLEHSQYENFPRFLNLFGVRPHQ
jgi:hypothetical protein